MKRPSDLKGMFVVLILAGVFLACGAIESKQDPPAATNGEGAKSGDTRGGGMTDEEFDRFVNEANDELEQKNARLSEEYGLGSFARWHFDQETELLQFFDENDRLALEADVIDIGSYSPRSNTWKWAWSNETVLPPLRKKAEKLKELEGLTGIALFSQEEAFEVEDEAMAWELAAIAVKHLGALGCYRAPSSKGGPHTFLAITNVRKVPGAAS